MLRLTIILLTAWISLAAEPDRPNVVILFADDLGYGSVSWYGSDIPTPHIDSIAENGIGFTSGYMTAPVCNPSRPGLMAGRYQQRWGKELNSQTVGPIGAPKKMLPVSEMALGTAMKRLGYSTAAIGKWQLGMDQGHHPLDRGFDFFVGMPSGLYFVHPSWPNARIAPGHRDLRDGDGGRARALFRGRERIPHDEYLTDRLGREGVAFIERHAGEPLFLYLAFHAPHGPIQTIDKYYQRFPQFDNETLRIYAAMISAVDDWVGAVLAKLREHGLEEKTLVIFTSDNGAQKTSDVDGKRNAPLIGHKRNLYEGGIRVPYVMQWKGRLEGGRRFDQPVSSLDVFPTALAAAGVKDLSPYRVDGVNLLPFLEGKKQGAPHEYLFWRSGPNAAVRKGPWKLLLSGTGLTRLYNVDENPEESKDLLLKHPRLVDDLKSAFKRWSKDKAKPREGARKIKTKLNGDVIEWHI
ncbi:MAG: sulfatase-like hydrolase/transferase [bacterium]|nr:sulfatase-like hydrolase/transferase [bacterium]